MYMLNNISKENILNLLIPLSIIGNVMNTGYLLKDKNFDNELSNFIVPSFLLFFSGPLSANIIYHQMIIDSKLVMCYILGVILFFLLKEVKIIRKFLFLFPVVLRVNFLLSLRFVLQPLSHILMWMTLCEFNSLILRKMFLENGRLTFKNKDLKGLVENILIVMFVRKYHVPFYMIPTIVVLCETSILLERLFVKTEIFKRGKKTKENTLIKSDEVKAKRGRKPKVVEGDAENMTVDSTIQTDKSQAKRGRKKKEQ